MADLEQPKIDDKVQPRGAIAPPIEEAVRETALPKLKTALRRSDGNSGGPGGTPPPDEPVKKLTLAPDFDSRQEFHLVKQLDQALEWDDGVVTACHWKKGAVNREPAAEKDVSITLSHSGFIVSVAGPLQHETAVSLRFYSNGSPGPQFEGFTAMELNIPKGVRGLLFLQLNPEDGKPGLVYQVVAKHPVAPYVVFERP